MVTRPMCPPGCENPDHYGCQLRLKGMQVSPRAQMTRTQNWKPTPSIPPAFNRQIMYEDRPGGYKSPILKPDGTPLRRKEYGEKRAKVDEILRTRKNATNAHT